MLDRFNTLMLDLYSRLQLQREEGQGTVEYALILSVIVLAVAAVLTPLGAAIAGKIRGVTSQLN